VKVAVAPSFTVCGVDGEIVPDGVPTLGVTVCVTAVSAAKFAMTVQFAVTAAVTYELPVSVPPQVPVTVSEWKPDAGASVNVDVAPLATVCGVDGEIVPLGVPTLGVTVKVTATPVSPVLIARPVF
jgi:hypothetical protein